MKNVNPKIQIINSGLVIDIRHKVLRKGKPLNTAVFDGDSDLNTIHIGAFYEDNIVGVVTLLKKSNNNFQETNQYQLRGMAVLDEFQNLGIGALLLNFGLVELNKIKSDLVWCNAREKASSFYLKYGFTTFGKPYEIEEIGIHYVMKKLLY